MRSSFNEDSYLYNEQLQRSHVSHIDVCHMEGSLMLNFLYKEPLITRVKSSNSKVGRKYANYEKGL